MKKVKPARSILTAVLAMMALTACSSNPDPSPSTSTPNLSSKSDLPFEKPAIDDKQIARYYIENGQMETNAKVLGKTEGNVLLTAACSSASQNKLEWKLTVGAASEEGGEVACGSSESSRVIEAAAGEELSLVVLHDDDSSLDGYVSITTFNQ